MNWHHAAHGLGEDFVHIASRGLIEGAPVFEVLLQFHWIHSKGASVNVHKIWLCAALGYSLGRGDECMRHGNDNIAGLHARSHKCKTKSISAAVDTDAMFCV